mmetsp:Transcript_43764/g.103411  ORF Transcript_43764/g.103411 Transcript_43764/m.103411 type:complete len:974 (+) Transcript_43764:105-3026(+)
MQRRFDMAVFEARLKEALKQVELVLHAEKHPNSAAEVHHKYDDKYLLVECMTNSAVASQLNCLAAIGVTKPMVTMMKEWSRTHAVSLRFRAEERCSFIKEETREVENPTKHVEELSVAGVVKSTFTSKSVTTVTEYFWKFEVSYVLIACRGTGSSEADCVEILKRSSSSVRKTATKSPPAVEARIPALAAEVNITWLLQQIQSPDDVLPQFKVDRADRRCCTPRRNPEVDAGFQHFVQVAAWCKRVVDYLQNLFSIPTEPKRQFDMAALRAGQVLVPVLPLMLEGAEISEDVTAAAAAASASEEQPEAQKAATDPNCTVLARLSAALERKSCLLSTADSNALLSEETRALQCRHAEAKQALPSSTEGIASSSEAIVAITLQHCASVCEEWGQALEFVEELLRRQLLKAIGKEVTPADFADYMIFHNRKVFAEAYAPIPFCFAVRRSEKHTPEGTVSIEQEVVGSGGDSNIAAPITTMVAKSFAPRMMRFPVSASTEVSFGGDRYLHAYLSHQFEGQSGAKLSVVSRARQFSSMIVLIGRITSATSFEPKYAAIVQNKDELKIPLDMSTIPTPKEFKDAIESLSPEQQNFAKAFRSMQLESTLFGIVVIQIKPQLEKVLNLPADSLTKEIKLTQDLMQLFIKYQIPSDLLSFDASGSADDGFAMVDPSPVEKLAAVKAHVQAMNDMIAQAKQEELQEARQERDFALPLLEEEEKVREVKQLKKKGAPFGGGGGMMKMRAAAPRSSMRSLAACQALPPPCGAPGGAMASNSAAPPPPPAPAPSQQPVAAAAQPQSQQAEAPQQHKQEDGEAVSDGADRDFTQVPHEMDRRFEELDTDSALRPTIITPSDTWTKRAQKALLASPTESTLRQSEQKLEKDAAFDLLDGLTKSGALPIDHASLHIVVAATHCFDRTVIETVVRDNVNPIVKVERSSLIMASTIHQVEASAMIQDSQLPRIAAASPQLFQPEQPASLTA